MAKQMRFDHEARGALRRGVDQVADVVRLTLGPRGRSVVLDRAEGAPAITTDGAAVAQEIDLPDPFENMGARLAREVGARTQDAVGDGTTTATVLVQGFVREGDRLVAAGARPMAVKRGIDRAVAAVVEEVARRARPVRGERDLVHIAALAAKDAEAGERVAEVLEAVGPDGVVTVQDGPGPRTTVRVTEGMRFDRGYLSPYFVTHPDRMTAVLEDASVLLLSGTLSAVQPVLGLLEHVLAEGRSLLLVAEAVDGDALATLVVNRLRGSLRVAAVPAPGRGDRRREILDDLAVLTGGVVFGEHTGRSVETAAPGDLGTAARVLVERSATTVFDGGGDPARLRRRVGSLRRLRDRAASDYDRESAGERLAALAGGVGVIEVGGDTDAERAVRRAAVEDALAAARAAAAEGVVPGGGLTLLRAASVLDGLEAEGDEALGIEVVRRGLGDPLRQIAINAGYDGATVVEDLRDRGDAIGFDASTARYLDLTRAGVLDPAKVVRSALQHAASIAGLILTTETLVVEVPDPPGGDGND